MYINSKLKLESENLLKILSKIRDTKIRLFELAVPRYQFNLKVIERNEDRFLANFEGKDLFVKEVINCEKFCFKPEFVIKRELYDDFTNKVRKEIHIGYTHISFAKNKKKSIDVYSNTSIYDKIEIGMKTEHCKVMCKTDGIMTELPQIGSSLDGLPFFEDRYVNEASTSGWWIEGSSIHFFINTFKNTQIKNIEIRAFFEPL